MWLKSRAALVALLFLYLFSGTQEARAQNAPCPNGASGGQEFTVHNVGDSITIPINLAPCQTVEVYESHDMQGDPNLGTNLEFKYLNNSGQVIFSQVVYGFLAGSNVFPSWQTEPFPWRGTVGPEGLPTTLVITSVHVIGYGTGVPPNPPKYPSYTIQYATKRRPGYNLGGPTFGSALAVSELPSTYFGSLRPEDQGQWFKVHLQGNQALYFDGYAEGKTNVGGGFTIEIYDQNGQDVTPNNPWLHTSDYGFNSFSKVFNNPFATPLDYYIRLTTWPWSVLNFKLTLSAGPVVRETPLIFIPGIMGSLLVNGTTGEDLWPGLGHDHTPLSLSPGGSHPNVVATDAIRRYHVPIFADQVVYEPLLEMLTGRGGFREYQVNNDPARRTAAGCDTSQRVDQPNLFVFAYDWRQSSADNAAALKEYVRCVQQFHPGEKIDILAHSMGGLIARRYILDNSGAVNRLITIASPWVGAPKGIKVLETGDAGLSWFLVHQNTLKDLIEYFPGAHELLPSRGYFDLGGRPFKERGDFNRNGEPNEVYDYWQLINTLNARHNPNSKPGTANQRFHEYMGAAQDDWRTDQTGVAYDHIIGERTRLDTIGQVEGRSLALCAFGHCISHDTFWVKMINGDGTVPKRSAARLSNTLNLNAPNSHRWYYSYAYTNQSDDQYEHNGLTKNTLVHDLVLYLLGRGPQPGSTPVEDAPPPETSPTPPRTPTAANTSYYVNATGVDYVKVTDSAGNTNTKVDDTFALPVPGVGYNQLGDKSALISVPADQTYTLSFQNGNEPVALEVVKGTSNDVPVEAVRYMDVQMPAGVQAKIQTTAAGVTELRYDGDGDGVYETVVQPTVALTGEAALDVRPPDLSVTATLQTDGSAIITLSAQDDGSGVKSISYSLDGSEFQPYTAPLNVSASQVPKVYAFADDNAANRSNLLTQRVPRGRALLVVGSTPLASGDGMIRMRLEDLAFSVTFKTSAEAASADAQGQQLIVIAPTASPADVNTKFRDAGVPVLVVNGEVFDDMGLTGTLSGSDFGVASSQTDVTISDPTHPLAAGLSGTVSVTGQAGDFAWGLPGTAAHKVVTKADDPNKSAVFGYDAGAQMPGLNAPARRAGLFLTAGTAENLDQNGWKLFDAAANWAAGVVNNAPTVNITSPLGGQFFNPNTNINVNADAGDPDGRVVKVDFYAGSALVGTSTSSPFGVIWANVPAGNYALTAVATDDFGATTTSSPVQITVNVSSGVIEGHVTQPNGSTPVGGASIHILSGTTQVASATTDAAGAYRVEGLDPSTYAVECSAEGYEPQSQGGVVVTNGATTVLNLQLAFALPVIDSVAPAVGASGTAVMITGSHFFASPASNQVKFNGAAATVSAASTTSLTVSVPAGATSGRLTVTTPSGTSTSPIDFFVPPQPYASADVETTGRMAVGETRTVTVSTSGKVALVAFDGIANRRISLKVTGVSLAGGNGYLDVSIRKPNGSTLTSQSYISYSGAFFDATTLPSTGGYTILVDPQGTNTGSVTLSLYDVPDDLSGSITPGGQSATVTLSTPGQNGLLSFNGTSGQRVSLKTSGVSLTQGNGYLDVSIRKPDGSTLASSSYISSGGNFIDIQTLSVTGTYSILVNPQGSNIGSATLTLYDVPADAASTITAGGSNVTLTTSVPGQNGQATFSGTSGQRISLRITGASLTGGNGYLDVLIKKPDGSTLASTSYVYVSGFIDVLTLPVTGTYAIFVNPQGSNVGNVTLTLYDVPADSASTIAPDGSPVTLMTTAPGQNAQATFSGAQGQRISLKITGVTLTQGNGYVDVFVRKPDGSTLASTSYVSSSGFIDVLTLPVAGTYTIFVDPQTTNVGSVTLALYEVPADITGGLTVDGTATDVAINVPGQNAALTFSGTAGQQVTVRLTNSALAPVTVRLLKPDGSTLTSYTSYGGSSFNLSTQTLPSAGTYTVSIDPSGANTGGISVRVTNGSIGWLKSVFEYYFSLTA
jgi:pimeloyl-ACP methyl ester carboxylesterase